MRISSFSYVFSVGYFRHTGTGKSKSKKYYGITGPQISPEPDPDLPPRDVLQHGLEDQDRVLPGLVQDLHVHGILTELLLGHLIDPLYQVLRITGKRKELISNRPVYTFRQSIFIGKTPTNFRQ